MMAAFATGSMALFLQGWSSADPNLPISPREENHEGWCTDQDPNDAKQRAIDQRAEAHVTNAAPHIHCQAVARTIVQNAMDGQKKPGNDQAGRNRQDNGLDEQAESLHAST